MDDVERFYMKARYEAIVKVEYMARDILRKHKNLNEFIMGNGTYLFTNIRNDTVYDKPYFSKIVHFITKWDDVRFTEELDKDAEAQRGGKIIYVNRKNSTDYDKIMSSIIHESAHISSGTGDMMEGFEEELVRYNMILVHKCKSIIDSF